METPQRAIVDIHVQTMTKKRQTDRRTIVGPVLKKKKDNDDSRVR
jgi:hypothetical protein